MSLSLSFATQADTDGGEALHPIVPGKEKIKSTLAYKQSRNNLYYIQFKDQPLVSYQGGLKGLKATSSVLQSNKTIDGKLNTKSAQAIAYKSYLKQAQDATISRISQKLKRSLAVKHRYDTVLNAVTAELTNNEIAQIQADSDVLSVEKVGVHFLHSDSGPSHVQAPQIWDNANSAQASKGEGVIVGIIDTGINAYHPSFADVGADGYDHTNPNGSGVYLGDCIEYAKFCNDKLIGIVSYPEIVDNRPNIVNETPFEEIEDKIAVGYDFHGHGSHVASTAAGNILRDVNYYLTLTDDVGVIEEESAFDFEQISGVAPHANIVSYQVCDEGGCYPELTLRALEHAIENGVDAINYSVGGSPRDPWSSIDGVAFLNARKAGIHVATSAGNSGPEPETIGSPGNSPWITTVAAFTHDRSFTSKLLTGFTGGESTPADLIGEGATKAYTGNIVLASEFGTPGCTEEFEENTFNGEIVVCERGEIARVRKGMNVKAGGAGGMILINVDSEVDSVNKDHHVLPTIHLNTENGEVLSDWLATGTDHAATINAAQLTDDAELGDVAGVFSSRGPNLPYAGIFGPDIAAPGVDIYAANAEDMPFVEEGGLIPYTTMSGTSMSSPHVAGILALIHAVHPDWTPAEVQSALMGTAHRETFKDDNYSGEKERADFFDQGAGSARVYDAINSGLILDTSFDEYMAADPTNGGDISSLNMTSVSLVECLGTCTWTREVKATKSATWNVSYEYLNPGFEIVASPSEFTLAAGETQIIEFTATANINLADEWVHGYTVFTPSDDSISTNHFQASINYRAGDVASEITATLDNNNRTIVIEDAVTIGTPELQKKGFGLFPSTVYQGSAIGATNDLDRNSVYRNRDTIVSIPFVVKPYTKKLIVEIIESTSPDMDLYIGIDENGDGYPDATEMYYSLICISGNLDSVEKCEINAPPTGNYWLVAQNYEGSAEGVEDTVSVRAAMIGYSFSQSFDVDAPSVLVQDQVFDINLSVNGVLDSSEAIQPLEADVTYYGLLELGTTAEQKRNIGTTLLTVTSTENFENRAPVFEGTTAIQGEYDFDAPFEFSQDLTLMFTDPDKQALTFELVSDIEGIEIVDNVLNVKLSDVVDSEFTITATDGDASVTATFTVMVELANQTPTVNQHTGVYVVDLDKSNQGSLSLDVSGWFSDVDGDTLSFEATGHDALTVNGNNVVAQFTSEGVYRVTVTASDDEYSVSTVVNVTVNKAKSDGGSTSSLLIAMLIFIGLYRRKRAY